MRDAHVTIQPMPDRPSERRPWSTGGRQAAVACLSAGMAVVCSRRGVRSSGCVPVASASSSVANRIAIRRRRRSGRSAATQSVRPRPSGRLGLSPFAGRAALTRVPSPECARSQPCHVRRPPGHPAAASRGRRMRRRTYSGEEASQPRSRCTYLSTVSPETRRAQYRQAVAARCGHVIGVEHERLAAPDELVALALPGLVRLGAFALLVDGAFDPSPSAPVRWRARRRVSCGCWIARSRRTDATMVIELRHGSSMRSAPLRRALACPGSRWMRCP